MTQEVINVGVNADDGTGDSLYEAGQKINSNFTELFDIASVKADIKFFGNNITSRLSNADIFVHPSGTGTVLFPGIRFNDNNIEVLNTNDDIKIRANGSGKVTIAGLGFSGTTISAPDSSSVNINENLIVDGDYTTADGFTFSGAQTFATDMVFGNLTLGNGSIVDSSGAISFGDENLTTTGTINSATGSTIGNLTLANGSITDSSGAISFGNENLTTSGTLSAATGSQFGNLDFLNGTINDSSGAISFGNENLSTTGTSFAINSTLTVANGSITDSSGAISFGNENVTTTGTIARATGSTIGNLTLADGSITDSGGAISFGDENLTTTATSMAIGSTLTAANGSITDSTGALSFGDENISTTGTLTVDGLSTFGSMSVSGATSFADSITVDNLTFNDNIISTSSNADLRLSPGGTGVVNVSNLTIDASLSFTDNVLKVTTSNADLDLVASGSGSVVINNVNLDAGTIDNTVIGANEPAAGNFTQPIGYDTLVIPDKITFSGNTMSANRSNDNLEFEASGSGKVTINDFLFPNSDGGIGQVMRTDGSKTLSFVTLPILLGSSDITDEFTTISFRESTGIDHVTSTGRHNRIESGTAAMDVFATSRFDSAFYLMINRDDASNELEVLKHSVAHNNTNAFIATHAMTKTGTNNHIITTADVNSSNVRLLGTGSSPENSSSFYRIGLGDNDSTGYSGEEEVGLVINTDVDSASETIDTFAKADFRGAKYYISVNNASKTEVSNMEALVVHDGSAAYITVYNQVNTGSNDLITLTAAISGSNVVVSAAGLEDSLRVHAYRVILADDEADRSSTNINVIGEVTVSSASTTLDTFDTGTYQGAHYIVVAYNSSEAAASICEAAVVSDGTNAFITQYSMTSTKGTDQILLTASHSSTTTTVSATSTSGGSTTVNAYRVNLARPAGASSATATLDTISASTYRSAKYNIQIVDNTAGSYELMEANVTHDGSDAYISTFGSVGTSTGLITVAADINSGNIRLRGTINNTNDHAVTVVRRIIED